MSAPVAYVLAAVFAVASLHSCAGLVISGPDEAAPADSNKTVPKAAVVPAKKTPSGPARIWPEPDLSVKNLCIKGQLAPEFILLGVVRSGTGSFAKMLDSPQTIWATTQQGEPATFSRGLHMFDDEDRFKQGKGFWLSHYPKCNSSVRQIAVDATPEYMLTEVAPLAAKRMKEFYHHEAPLVKFGIIMREPLARIQSAFHYYQHQGWNSDSISVGFPDYIRKYIVDPNRDPKDDPCQFVMNTNYTSQIKAYLDVGFYHQQFIVIPFGDLVEPKGDAISHVFFAIWQSLGLKAGWRTTIPPLEHLNEIPHVDLAKEVNAPLRAAAQKALDKSINTNALVDVLSKGVVLPTFFHPLHAKVPAKVNSWLRSRW